MADQYQSKQQYSTPADSYNPSIIKPPSPEAIKKIQETQPGATPYQPDPRLVRSGGGSSGGGSSGGYRLSGITQPTPQAVEQVSRSAYGVQGGYQGDVRIMGGQQIRVTSAARAGPESNAAYNAAYSAKGEINRKLGGQEYILVTEQNGEFIVEQNPRITPQPGIAQQIRDFLGASPGVTVVEEGGRFRVTEKPSVSSTAAAKPPSASAPRPSLSLGLADVQPKGTPQMGSPTDNILYGYSRYSSPSQYSTPAGGQEVVVRRESSIVPLSPEQVLGVQSRARPRTIAGAVSEASQASQAQQVRFEQSGRPKATVSSITTPVNESPFEATPIYQIYNFKLGESLLGSAGDVAAAVAGPGGRVASNVVFALPAYAADVTFETAKVAAAYPLLVGESAQIAGFKVREAAGLPATGQERAALASDTGGIIPYNPAVPVFVASTVIGGTQGGYEGGKLFGQAAETQPIQVYGEAGQVRDFAQIKVGPAQVRVETGSRPYTPPSTPFYAEDSIRQLGLGVRTAESGPVRVESGRYISFVPKDPFALEVSKSAEFGLTLGGLEAGKQTVENLGAISQGQRAPGYDVGKILVATGSGAFVIYPASRYVPYAGLQMAPRETEAPSIDIPYRRTENGRVVVDVYTGQGTIRTGEGPKIVESITLKGSPPPVETSVITETGMNPTRLSGGGGGGMTASMPGGAAPSGYGKPPAPFRFIQENAFVVPQEYVPATSYPVEIRPQAKFNFLEIPAQGQAAQPGRGITYRSRITQESTNIQFPAQKPSSAWFKGFGYDNFKAPGTDTETTNIPIQPPAEQPGEAPQPAPGNVIVNVSSSSDTNITENVNINVPRQPGILGGLFGAFAPGAGGLGSGGMTTGRRARTPGEARSLLEVALSGTETNLKIKPPKVGLKTPLG